MPDISAERISARLSFQDGPLSINPDSGSQSPMETRVLCVCWGGQRRADAPKLAQENGARFFHRINTTGLFKRQNSRTESSETRRPPRTSHSQICGAALTFSRKLREAPWNEIGRAHV